METQRHNFRRALVRSVSRTPSVMQPRHRGGSRCSAGTTEVQAPASVRSCRCPCWRALSTSRTAGRGSEPLRPHVAAACRRTADYLLRGARSVAFRLKRNPEPGWTGAARPPEPEGGGRVPRAPSVAPSRPETSRARGTLLADGPRHGTMASPARRPRAAVLAPSRRLVLDRQQGNVRLIHSACGIAAFLRPASIRPVPLPVNLVTPPAHRTECAADRSHTRSEPIDRRAKT